MPKDHFEEAAKFTVWIAVARQEAPKRTIQATILEGTGCGGVDSSVQVSVSGNARGKDEQQKWSDQDSCDEGNWRSLEADNPEANINLQAAIIGLERRLETEASKQKEAIQSFFSNSGSSEINDHYSDYAWW